MPARHPLAALALVALIGAGCGSSTASDTGTARNAGQDLSAQEKAVKFAECIRSHGVPHFPDPDAKGQFDFGVDVSEAVWTKAVNACQDLRPPGAVSGKRTPQQQATALKFAQCIRENGVKDFPDPANGDPIIDTTHIPSANQPGGMTILNAAVAKCRDDLRKAIGGR